MVFSILNVFKSVFAMKINPQKLVLSVDKVFVGTYTAKHSDYTIYEWWNYLSYQS